MSHQTLKAPAERCTIGLVLIADGLTVVAPNGTILLDAVSLYLEPGRATVVSGPSGAGKSTLLRALLDRAGMEAEGFLVRIRELHGIEEAGLVPQRGAPFDHLDVAGNLLLAMRGNQRSASASNVEKWLAKVDLDAAWARIEKPVAHLSGGQAQRLAVARVLASGRDVLLMDEPSVGLDPDRVQALAAQIRAVCDAGGAVLVVTHDPAFAADFADDVLVLRDARFESVALGARIAGRGRTEGERAHVERALRVAWSDSSRPAKKPALALVPQTPSVASRVQTFTRNRLSVLEVLGSAMVRGVQELGTHPRDFLRVAGYVLRQSLLRPLPFYGAVSLLLGFTLLYVLTSFGQELSSSAAVQIVGGLPAIALAPSISAFLFVAASSNSTNAWLGSMRLSKQVAALEALGIDRRAYLWGPAFWTLAASYVVVATVFLLGLIVGGCVFCDVQGIDGGWSILTRELVDPTPERAAYVVRAKFLVAAYSVGIASDAISKADREKDSTDSVTRAMTSSVVACTLWVVALELASLFVLRDLRGAP